MAGGKDNLVPNEARTPEERRENASKAGKASVAARRRKKQAAEYMRIALELPNTSSPELVEKMIERGIPEEDCTYGASLAWSILLRGIKGNVRAAELAYKIAQQAEAAELAEKEKRAARRRAKAEKEEASSDGFLEALAAAAQNAFPAGDDSDMLPEPDDLIEEDEDASP